MPPPKALARDLDRAVNTARWGVGARFCDPPTGEGAVLRAAKSSQETYRSWEDFGAGCTLGRCPRFDEEEFGPWNTEPVDMNRILTSDPDRPWLTVPWR